MWVLMDRDWVSFISVSPVPGTKPGTKCLWKEPNTVWATFWLPIQSLEVEGLLDFNLFSLLILPVKKLRHREPKSVTHSLVPDRWQSQNKNTSHLRLNLLLFLPHPDLLVKISPNNVNTSYNWCRQAVRKRYIYQIICSYSKCSLNASYGSGPMPRLGIQSPGAQSVHFTMWSVPVGQVSTHA